VIPPFRFYLFDVDGTLLDSAPDICGAIRELLSTRSQDGLSEAYLRSFIGLHLIDLFQDIFPSYSTGQIDELIQNYRGIYRARGHRQTKVFPGVDEALAALGGSKSTVTTKSTETTRTVLGLFGLLRHFDRVQGTDGFPSKPAPDVVRRSLEALSGNQEECLLVGDSAADMEAGRRAGVKTCAVRYGYGNPEEMARWKPDYWVSDLRELLS
jgi:phosphoglycolate phosphatase